MIKTSLTQRIIRIILGCLMLLAGIGHCTSQRAEFQALVPDWIPISKDLVVILSGVMEVLLGLGILVWTKKMAQIGILLAIFLLIIFPGNIAQYVNGINAFGLDTDEKRLTRLFFQPILIVAALWSSGALAHLRAIRKQK